MDKFKSPVSCLAELFKKSRDAWKAKALEKQRRLRAAQVKVRDPEQSREQWKKRALEAEKALTEAAKAPERAKTEPGRDARWKAFPGHCRDSLASFQQIEPAFLRPPRQRTKARFMHVDAPIEWARRLLAYHDRGDFSAIEARFSLDWSRWQVLMEQFGPEPTLALRPLIATPYPSEAAFRQALEAVSGPDVERIDPAFWHSADAGRQRFIEGFGWLLDYRRELADYAQLIAQSEAIQSCLKTEGLRNDAREALQQHLQPLSTPAPRVAKVTEQILDHVEMEAAKLPDNTTRLASSDIIESVFGKYKHFTAKGPLKEIGKLVLAIPAFVSDLSTHLIKEAMESVRTIDVDDWVSTHLGTSMLAKRRRALTPHCGRHKKCMKNTAISLIN